MLFGGFRSKIDTDLIEMCETVSRNTNWVYEFDKLSNSDHFEHRTCYFNGNKLRLLSVASTPTVMKINDPLLTIAMPIYGNYKSWVGKDSFEYSHADNAMYFPQGKRHTEGGDKSALLISLDRRQMLETFTSMTNDQKGVNLNLDDARLAKLRIGQFDFVKAFKSLTSLIDQFNDHGLIKNFGLEDSIYRASIILLKPELFLDKKYAEIDRKPNDSAIDGLCQWIDANLDSVITLTELETISGLTARSLQYGFKKKFSCSPMQWIRDRRLIWAHKILSNAASTTKISHVALNCGFTSFSEFSRQYLIKFGEQPNVTLRNSLNNK